MLAVGRSFIFSVDMAHAVHPNYASKHERQHSPTMNSGIVIKTNDNQRYTTNGVSGFFVRELARRAGVPVQDSVCATTVPAAPPSGPCTYFTQDYFEVQHYPLFLFDFERV